MASQRGQATLEWIAVVLLVALVLGAAVSLAAALHAPWIGRTIRCAVLAGCQGEDARLEAVYGADAAAFVRAYAPNVVYEPGTLTLPVDYRRCRSHRCSDAADLAGEDVWRTTAGRRATVFTRVVDRRAGGGDLHVQYWLYYPDSTYFGPAHAAGRRDAAGAGGDSPAGEVTRTVAGHHADDWESYQVRVTATGEVYGASIGSPRLRRDAALAQPQRAALRAHGAQPVRQAGVDTPRPGPGRPATGLDPRLARQPRRPSGDRPGRGERRTEADGLVLVPIEAMAAHDHGRRLRGHAAVAQARVQRPAAHGHLSAAAATIGTMPAPAAAQPPSRRGWA